MISSNYFTQSPRLSPGSTLASNQPAPNQVASADQLTPAMPWLLETLLRNLDFDLEQVADVIDPILTAQNHCQGSGLYVQGIVVSDRCFITTNLNLHRAIWASSCGTHWLLGQSAHCGITLLEGNVAPYHAALDFNPQEGFSLTDLGSQLGTRINGRPLAPDQPRLLQEGDVVQLG
ncbi:MAG: FHA domain-containing protein [Leptolyngbyaceae cyanobacterium SM2_5_2]|nr:FHA domain-containing protein [Leptolyngbyaceae cyanobacterium SM2_5_2]